MIIEKGNNTPEKTPKFIYKESQDAAGTLHLEISISAEYVDKETEPQENKSILELTDEEIKKLNSPQKALLEQVKKSVGIK